MIILAEIDRFREDGIDLDHHFAVHKLRRAKVLEPVFSGFNRIQLAHAVMHRIDHRGFATCRGHIAIFIDTEDDRVRPIANEE